MKGSTTRRVVLGTVVVLLALAVGAASTLVFGNSSTEISSGNLAGVIDAADFAPRESPAQAWVDGRLFVFGGTAMNLTPGRHAPVLLTDGALMAPNSAEAFRVSAAPFEPPLYGPVAVAVGNQVVVLGISCTIEFQPGSDVVGCAPGDLSAATYDVEADQWTPIELPPGLGATDADAHWVTKGLGATSDGRAVFAVTSGLSDPAVFWAFSPATSEWMMIPGPERGSREACLSGDTLVVLTTRFEQDGKIIDSNPIDRAEPGQSVFIGPDDGIVLPSLALLDLNATPSWTVTAPATDIKYPFDFSPQIACMSGRVGVMNPVNVLSRLRIYDRATGVWTVPAQPPSEFFVRDKVGTDSELVFLPTENDVGTPGLAFNPTTGSWRQLGGLPPVTRGAFWNGSDIVGYGEPIPSSSIEPDGVGYTDNPAGPYAYRP